jgi:hypothetical protein
MSIYSLLWQDWDVFPFQTTLRGYDPQKYELRPKKDFVDKLLKEKDDEIAYHEEKIKVLREQKERLLSQKQE